MEQTSTLTFAHQVDVDKLLFELQDERARRLAAEAEAQRLRELVATYERITRASHWLPRDRIILAALIAQANATPSNSRFVELQASAEDVGNWAGLKPRSARDSLTRIAEAGIIKRRVEHGKVNRYGQDIPLDAGDPDRGDHWNTTVMLDLPKTIGDKPLPALTDTPHLTRSRTVATAQRKELTDLRETLRHITCPSCGAEGDFSVVCNECGAFLHLDGQNLPSAPAQDASEPTRQSLPGAPMAENATYSSIDDTFCRNINTEAGGMAVAPLSVSEPQPAEILTGAATVAYFDDQGEQFVLLAPRSKRPIERDWQDTPRSADETLAHLAGGGNVGVLTGLGRYCCVMIDVDDSLADLLARYPQLVTLPRIVRQDAPDRAKLLCFTSDDNAVPTRHYKGNQHKIDLLGNGAQGVVAGVHESGATIELRTGAIVCFDYAELERIGREWAGEPAGKPSTSMTTQLRQVQPADTLVRAAIAWWNADPGNQAEVDRLIAKQPHKNGYVAIRSDDHTPSTRLATDGYDSNRRTWRDYGARETLDDYEVYCRLSGSDKRTHKWDVVDDYKAYRVAYL